MRPTNRELLDGIAEALRDRVAPAAAGDPWAASELRSIDALLAMVAARDEHEVECLVEDNADLGDVLAQLGVLGPVAPALGLDPRPALREHNDALQTQLESTIHELHRDERLDDIALVRAYLQRSAGRDARLYGPLMGRALF